MLLYELSIQNIKCAGGWAILKAAMAIKYVIFVKIRLRYSNIQDKKHILCKNWLILCLPLHSRRAFPFVYTFIHIQR